EVNMTPGGLSALCAARGGTLPLLTVVIYPLAFPSPHLSCDSDE
ncbi:MAG: hypothetical protein QOG46_1133, partial [Pseudonocardiales bacterium]|nr:hypothetical protein [Pseudonocardiales bacterium]